MLKRLQLKFILITMTLVTIMSGVIFGLLYYSTEKNLERESIQAMESLSSGHGKPGPPGQPDQRFDRIHLPYFSLFVDADNEIVSAEGNFFDLSDIDLLNTILSSVLLKGTDRGILSDYDLRFLRVVTPMGSHVVFMDMTSERSTLSHLVQTLVIIGIAEFLVFLLISIVLARWAVKPVSISWKQQKQFVADASHELKTPLTVIMTDAELLHAPDCPEEDRHQLSENILTMSSQMRGLVESLLDLARIDNESVKEEACLVSFSDITSENAMIFEPVFFEKGLSLRYEIEENINIEGIPSHLKQLPSILLDNACKYSKPGGETSVRLSRLSQKRCLLEVSDEGEPIPEEDLQNIFKRFYRADKARTMNHSYGLGLSIAKSITEEHHGKIYCKSSDGYNQFYIELPCEIN